MINKEEKNVVDPCASHFATSQDDGINLYDLWSIIVKRKKVIIAIFIIFLMGAIIYCFITPNIYRVVTYIRVYIPKYLTSEKDLSTARDLPTTKELSMRLFKIDRELYEVVFQYNAKDISYLKIEDLKGTTDKLIVTIESRNREALSKAPQQLISYIENIPEYKAVAHKIEAELNEKKELVKKEIEFQKLFGKFINMKVLPVIDVDDPTFRYIVLSIHKDAIDLKMEKYRLEHEIKDFKLIQSLGDPFISKYPVRPNKPQIISLAGIVGLMLGVFIVFIMEYFEVMKKKSNK